MLSQPIEEFIKTAGTDLLTDLFIGILLVAFLMGWLLRYRDKLNAYTQYTPTLLTTVGILGTFVGIVAGLLEFNEKNIDASIGALLAGMKTAFTTSLVGMSLSVSYRFLVSIGVITPRKQSVFYKLLVSIGVITPKEQTTVDEEQLGTGDIFKVMEEQRDGILSLREAIGGGGESSLTSQMKLLRSDMNDSMKESRATFETFQEQLWSKLQDFADVLSKSATETVIEALNEVIHDFNTNLTEQFGDNFKQLNEAVQNLVEWQENYKNQLEEMMRQYTQAVTAITETEASVTKISEHTTQIPEYMERLSEVIASNQHQIEELDRHLQAFSDVRDKAVEAMPQLDERIEHTLTSVETSSTRLSEGLSGATQKLVEDFTTMNTSLTTASNEVVSNNEQIKTLLVDVTTNINTSFLEMTNRMNEHTESITVKLREAGEALIEDTSRIRQDFESSLDTMKEALAGSIRQITEQQANEVQKLVSGVGELMKGTISDTAKSLGQQIQDLDKNMGDELNKSLDEMGAALASITEEFTKGYKPLVDRMHDALSSLPRDQ